MACCCAPTASMHDACRMPHAFADSLAVHPCCPQLSRLGGLTARVGQLLEALPGGSGSSSEERQPVSTGLGGSGDGAHVRRDMHAVRLSINGQEMQPSHFATLVKPPRILRWACPAAVCCAVLCCVRDWRHAACASLSVRPTPCQPTSPLPPRGMPTWRPPSPGNSAPSFFAAAWEGSSNWRCRYTSWGGTWCTKPEASSQTHRRAARQALRGWLCTVCAPPMRRQGGTSERRRSLCLCVRNITDAWLFRC